MIYEYTNYRSFLKGVLANKNKRNNSYSLRAMASQLRISPALLSGVLNAHRNLSQEKAIEIASALNLNKEEI